MHAKITNLAQFKQTIKDLDKKAEKNTIAAVKKGTQRIAGLARGRVPVRSGELRSTIREEYSKSGLTGYVKAGYGKLPRSKASGAMSSAMREKLLKRQDRLRGRLEKANSSVSAMKSLDLGIYGPVVEYGDKRRNKPKRPFLQPAFRMSKAGILAEIESGYDKAWKELGGTTK